MREDSAPLAGRCFVPTLFQSSPRNSEALRIKETDSDQIAIDLVDRGSSGHSRPAMKIDEHLRDLGAYLLQLEEKLGLSSPYMTL